VVDDNATNLRILDEVLGNWGMQPKMVTGAFEAMDALRDAKLGGQPFALVLSDVNMPDVDGLMLAEQIRADSDLADTTIMMLTSGERITEVSRRKELGIVACLMKPIKQSELMDGIVSALDPQPLADLATESDATDSIVELLPLQILLAEDSLTNQTLAVALLESRGHKVAVANNGCEALVALAGDHNYDVVLMDVQMPEMDGFEATERIRDMEKNSQTHTPIIAMTAHAMAGDRERCLSAGMDEYVSKPIRIGELTERIGKCLRAQATSNSTPSLSGNLDWSAALEMTGGDRQVLKVVVEAILEEWPALLQQLDSAILSGDASTVQRAAHTIGGTARGFQANEVAETAALIDAQARSGSLENADELLRSLKAHIEPVNASFVAFLAAEEPR
jgi:CheY-like chemotaxis protein